MNRPIGMKMGFLLGLFVGVPLPPSAKAEALGPCSRRTDLVISEIMYHPVSSADGNSLEFLEIYNAGLIDINLSGYHLTGEWDYTFSHDVSISPGNVLVVANDPSALESHYQIHGVLGGFTQRLSNGGGRIRLRHPSGAILLEVNYDDQAPWPLEADGMGASLVLSRPSYGEDDARAWTSSLRSGGTPGTVAGPEQNTSTQPNRETPFTDLVISEIMYHPIDGHSELEYLELSNRTATTLDLSGWQITGGIRFEFAPGSQITPHGTVVVTKERDRFLEHYGDMSEESVFGNYTGRLSNRGETLRLLRPSTKDGKTTYEPAGSLTYHDGGLWSTQADGDGSSLELIDLRSDPRLGQNWAASIESDEAPWTSIEHTGTAAGGNGVADALEIILLGKGECLLDEIMVLNESGENHLVNPSFEFSSTFWTGHGTHSLTTLRKGEASEGERSLHLKAVARGNTGPNKVSFPLPTQITPGERITLRAQAKWLSGHPELILRLKGNYLEATGRLKLPPRLGSAGHLNSRTKPNTGPAISQVSHQPVLPADQEPVVVTAAIDDPDGIASIELSFRIDPSLEMQTIPMNDAGLDGDQNPNDGIYSSTIPGHPAGSLVAFSVKATDSAETPFTNEFPGPTPSTECLIRVGETQPPTTIPTYRLWMTAATLEAWQSGDNLDNTPHPVTFVYNNERVIQAAGALYAGSPHIAPSFNSPLGRPCGYNLILPGDQRFLGARELALDWPGRDPTALQEPTAYWIAEQVGLPFSHRRFIHLHVNGVTSNQRGTVFEDTQQINGDYVSSWIPSDDGGELYKAEQWFEFPANRSKVVAEHPKLIDFRTPEGDRNLALYRWLWLKRAVNGSAHDYQSLFELVDAANTIPESDFVSGLRHLIDIENWMGVMAVEQIVVNFDSYGSDIGKNMYAYKPQQGPWQLFMWDIDWVMLASARHGYHPHSPLMYLGPARFGEVRRDPVVARMYESPTFLRAYFRTIDKAVNGPLRADQVDQRLEALYQALRENGVTHSAGSPLEKPDEVKQWITQRRQFLMNALIEFDVPFQIHEPQLTSPLPNGRIRVTGSAPLSVNQIELNGTAYWPVWESNTTWSIEAPEFGNKSALSLRALDVDQNPILGTETTLLLDRSKPSLVIELNNDTARPQIVLHWHSAPGKGYEVQVSPRLSNPLWSTIKRIEATSHQSQYSELLTTGQSRFFRLLELP